MVAFLSPSLFSCLSLIVGLRAAFPLPVTFRRRMVVFSFIVGSPDALFYRQCRRKSITARPEWSLGCLKTVSWCASTRARSSRCAKATSTHTPSESHCETGPLGVRLDGKINGLALTRCASNLRAGGAVIQVAGNEATLT